MKPVSEANRNWQAATANAAWRARALQKPSSASNLNGESRDQTDHDPRPARTRAEFSMRQSGTQEPVSFRYAARLTAPFVAQLLGQILPDPERRASAAHLYDRETVRLSLGLDKRL
jgi:hypothetical protein